MESATPDEERWLMAAILDHLEREQERPEVDKDLVSSAAESLARAYGLDIHDTATRQHFHLDDLPLAAAHHRGRMAILGEKSNAAKMADEDTVDAEAFAKFVARLKRTTGFFEGMEEGSEEYIRRLARARAKFQERRGKKTQTQAPAEAQLKAPTQVDGQTDTPTGARSVPETQTEATASGTNASIVDDGISDDEKRKAEEIKLEGNAHLKAGRYNDALDCYTKCIELDGSNAVYYSNRAAAKMHLSQFSSAVDDCKIAISIDRQFIRAHERLATAYRGLEMPDLELETLENALRDHPGNELLTKLRNAAKARSEQTNAQGDRGVSSGGGFGGGMPSPEQMAGLAQSMGLNVTPEVLQSFMSSPLGGQLREAMSGNNPGMEQLLQQGMASMLSNPQAAQAQLSELFGGQGAGTGAGNNADPNSNSRTNN